MSVIYKNFNEILFYKYFKFTFIPDMRCTAFCMHRHALRYAISSVRAHAAGLKLNVNARKLNTLPLRQLCDDAVSAIPCPLSIPIKFYFVLSA